MYSDNNASWHIPNLVCPRAILNGWDAVSSTYISGSVSMVARHMSETFKCLLFSARCFCSPKDGTLWVLKHAWTLVKEWAVFAAISAREEACTLILELSWVRQIDKFKYSPHKRFFHKYMFDKFPIMHIIITKVSQLSAGEKKYSTSNLDV